VILAPNDTVELSYTHYFPGLTITLLSGIANTRLTVTQLSNVRGPTGVDGTTGHTGPTGERGTDGTASNTGATGSTGYTGMTGYTGPTGPPGTIRPQQSISYYLSTSVPANPLINTLIPYDTLDVGNSHGTVGFSYSNGILSNTGAPLTILVSGQVLTDNVTLDVNIPQPMISVEKSGNSIITSSAISFQGSSFTTTVVLGNGDTVAVYYLQSSLNYVNILPGQFSTRITFTQLDSVQGSTLVGTDLNNLPYTQNGFATPFINIGPAIGSPGAIGGWQLGPTGTGSDYTLTAQQNTPAGLTGPVYTILTPKIKIIGVNNATSGYTFKAIDRGSTFLLTSASNASPFGLSQGLLTAQDEGFYVNLKNATLISNNYTIPVFYGGTAVPSTGTSSLGSGLTAIMYWTGTGFMMYV
jgi:hypothetical protein